MVVRGFALAVAPALLYWATGPQADYWPVVGGLLLSALPGVVLLAWPKKRRTRPISANNSVIFFADGNWTLDRATIFVDGVPLTRPSRSARA